MKILSVFERMQEEAGRKQVEGEVQEGASIMAKCAKTLGKAIQLHEIDRVMLAVVVHTACGVQKYDLESALARALKIARGE